jgi:hypothetical protein
LPQRGYIPVPDCGLHVHASLIERHRVEAWAPFRARDRAVLAPRDGPDWFAFVNMLVYVGCANPASRSARL